ncbi:unnamed protein product [Closterium sp. Yama58-4]|nr:unnamed protein product [Closterium sp. Yama58-4]
MVVWQRNRFKALLTLLPALSADFLCVQEMDEYEGVYRQPMAAAGWESVYVKRPGKKRDGSGIFYRSSRFRLLRSQPINFNDLVPPDQPGQLAQEGTAVSDSSRSRDQLISEPPQDSTQEGTATNDDLTESHESRDLCDPRVRFKRDCVAIVAAFQERLLEQRTSWGQQVSSVLLAMLAAAVLASLSVLPTASPVYDFVWTRVMPMAVALVLLETDVTSAFTQSGPGLLAFLLGAAGTIAGTLVGFSLAGPSLGVEGWKVAACFCATYIGGSVNYAATAKALGMDITAGAAAASTGASLLTAGMAVDNLLMAAYFSVLAALPDSWPKPWESLTLSIAAAASACALADKIAVHLPPVMASAQLALAALLASLLSTVAARLTGRGEKRQDGEEKEGGEKEEGEEGEDGGSLFTGAETLGNALMLVFFATIGASASVSEAMSAGGGLLAFVATVLVVHIAVVLLGGRLLNIPLDILMVASNANVGGPATAAAMASARNWPQLVRPAVLLGTFGYTIGTAIAFLLGINVLQPMAAAALAKVL